MTDWLIDGFNLILGILIVSVLITSIRLWRGPSLADRVIALDLIVAAAVSLLAVLSVAHQKVMFLDIAIVLALVSFVATVAFALFLERRAREE